MSKEKNPFFYLYYLKNKKQVKHFNTHQNKTWIPAEKSLKHAQLDPIITISLVSLFVG